MDPGIIQLGNRRTEPYFNGEHLIETGNRFVAWIDLMGVLDGLRQRQMTPVIWRGELLTVIHNHINRSKAEAYTVGDGVIILTDDEDYRNNFTKALMQYYVRFNLNRFEEWDLVFHRMLRAGFGSGRVYHVDLETLDSDRDGGSPFIDEFPNTPFGPGIINAFRAEGGAPFSIHQAEILGRTSQVKWWDTDTRVHRLYDDQREALLDFLTEYFSYYDGQRHSSYDPDDSDHPEKAIDFFDGDDFGLAPDDLLNAD